MFKMIGKIVGILMVVIIVMALFSIISPVILTLGVLGVWYYTKKQPDSKMMKASVVAIVLGLFGSIGLMGAGTEEASEIPPEKTEQVAEKESSKEKSSEEVLADKEKAEAVEKAAAEQKAKEAELKAAQDAEKKAQEEAEEQALTDAKANGNSTETLQPILSTDSTIQSIELIEGTMRVVYKDEAFWSDNSLLTTFPSQPVDLMEIMKDNPNIGGYVFERLATMTDAKGNSSVYPIIVVYFSQSNAQSINYEEYDIRRYDNFYRVADALRIDMNIFRDTDLQKDGIEPNRGVDNNTFIDSANNYGQY